MASRVRVTTPVTILGPPIPRPVDNVRPNFRDDNSVPSLLPEELPRRFTKMVGDVKPGTQGAFMSTGIKSPRKRRNPKMARSVAGLFRDYVDVESALRAMSEAEDCRLVREIIRKVLRAFTEGLGTGDGAAYSRARGVLREEFLRKKQYDDRLRDSGKYNPTRDLARIDNVSRATDVIARLLEAYESPGRFFDGTAPQKWPEAFMSVETAFREWGIRALHNANTRREFDAATADERERLLSGACPRRQKRPYSQRGERDSELEIEFAEYWSPRWRDLQETPDAEPSVHFSFARAKQIAKNEQRDGDAAFVTQQASEIIHRLKPQMRALNARAARAIKKTKRVRFADDPLLAHEMRRLQKSKRAASNSA